MDSRAFRLAWPPVAALVILVLAWPIASITPRGGVDGSWSFALHDAAKGRLEYGTEVLYTYGPLGFLTEPYLYYDATGIPAFFWSLLLAFGLLLALILSSRSAFTPVLAVAAVFVFAEALRATTGYFGELPALIAFVIVIAATTSRIPLPWAWWATYAIGAFAAVALLGKSSAGVIALVLCTIAVAALPPGGVASLIRGGLAFVVTLAFFWLASGGSLAAIPTWLDGLVRIVTGFGEAMQIDPIDRPAWELQGFLALTGAIAALVIWRLWSLEPVRAVAAGAATALLALFLLKRGFTRYDEAHVVFSFVALAVIPLSFPWIRWQRLGAIGLTGAALGLGFSLAGAGPSQLDPREPVADAGSQLRTIVDPERRDDVRADAVAAIQAESQLDPETLELADGRSVHVGPWDLSAIWAYDLDGHSPPIFQDFQAYTAELDQRNADFLESDDAPEVVLRHTGEGRGAIDIRSSTHEAPRSNTALLCNYREIRATDDWQVLERDPGRCGAPTEIERIEGVPPGQQIPIPTAGPDDVVFARVEHSQPVGERLRRAAYKPSDIAWLILGDGLYLRAVPEVLDGPLLLRVPDAAGHTFGFGTVNNNDKMALDIGTDYDITFYRMPIDGT